ncbi:unnamed protein product [Caenorhabditis bovis]|uniref:RING-type domain-containing protein n=1 Tax=Caenorhabditis bovis TaxID=2654633 RepID=A0A8S1EJI7_9PELO|nr:unnamed protein product [Caenorhabditis bovis]
MSDANHHHHHEQDNEHNVNEGDNNGPAAANDDRWLGERNIREGIEHIRQRLDSTREGQTLVSFFVNTLPFVLLFSIKFIFDHAGDIFLLGILISFFLQADYQVQKVTSGAITNKYFMALYTIGYTLTVLTYLSVGHVEDFNFQDVFSLNLKYFLSGEFNSLSMISTFFGIVVIDTTFKLITVIPKLVLVTLPDMVISGPQRRKLLQFVEYCAQLYRCALPVGPCIRFFLFGGSGVGMFSYILTFSYTGLKVGELFRYSGCVRRTMRYLFKESSFGTTPQPHDIEDDMCTVCHENMTHPIMLDCKHIFCRVCIETWLDKNTTCPMCRAVVTQNADNEWKTGMTSKSIRFF